MISLSARALADRVPTWRSTDGAPAYRALADAIRLLVLDGRVGLGVRLPAERELAAQLGVSRTTVAAAYAALREDGHLRSIRGSGSVTRLPASGVVDGPGPGGGIDFGTASAPAHPMLGAAYAVAAETAAAHFPSSGYDLLGLPALRAAIADRFTERGLATAPEEIMVTLGAQHAIALVARALVERGDRAMIENPTYPHAAEALRAAGARLAPVGVSDDGWDLDGLLQQLRRASPVTAYLQPDFQNPTGARMPSAVRDEVRHAAARQGTRLIVDETIGELAFDRASAQPPFGGSGTIHLGSLGKTVWGGLRIGWIRADRTTIDRLVSLRFAGDLGTPLFEQLVALHLVERYDDVLSMRAHQLQEGERALRDALAEHLPAWRVPEIEGGMCHWVHLGAPVSSRLVLAARPAGLRIAAGPWFGVDGAFERFLRIPFGLPAPQIQEGVRILAAVAPEAFAAVGHVDTPTPVQVV